MRGVGESNPPNHNWAVPAIMINLPIEASKFKQMGVRAGFPDLILLIPNRFYPFCGIELKAKTGRQSENQKAYQKEFESIGAKYVVVRSLDEFIKVVDNYLKDI